MHESDLDADAIARETRQLLEKVNLADPHEYLQVVREWYARDLAECSPAVANHRAVLLSLYKALSSTGTLIVVNDESTHLTGRDFTNVAAGKGASFKARDVTTFKTDVDQAGSMNPQIADLLKSGRDAIETWQQNDVVKSAVLQNYEQLATELAKPEPDKGALEVFWGGVKSVAASLEPVAKLGAALVTIYKITGG